MDLSFSPSSVPVQRQCIVLFRSKAQSRLKFSPFCRRSGNRRSVFPPPLRPVNLLPVLIGDSALGKPESPFANEEEKSMKSRTWMWMTVMSLFAALAIPAQARVVYTPVNVNLPTNGSYPIDLNHDGITDFTFQIVRPYVVASTGLPTQHP